MNRKIKNEWRFELSNGFKVLNEKVEDKNDECREELEP